MNIYEALCAAWSDRANGHEPNSGCRYLYKTVQNHIDGLFVATASDIAPEELRFLGDMMHSAARKIEEGRK